MRWQPAAFLHVTGDDAKTFLQGQFTNDLRGLGAGGAVYGLWLTVKGKVLADSVVLRGAAENEFWICSYFSQAATIRERLESHVIADDVVIDDRTADWAGLALIGAGARAVSPPTDGFVFPGRRTRGENLEWLVPRALLESARERVPDAVELDAAAGERLRVSDGIPAVPFDVGPADLPNEGGLEADAVSYTKGCYLGQEVMARLKSMGQVRRRLLRVRVSAPTRPVVPAALFIGTRQVGELRSIASESPDSFIGLAMLSLLHVRADASLAFSADAPSTVTLMEAP